LAADAAARDRLAAAMANAAWGEPLAAHRALRHPGFAFTALANSMAVRHADLHLAVDGRPVLSARGVSGIDGTLAHFAGAGRALGRGLLLCGDLAALHDLPGLMACAGGDGGAIVVLDNGGGAIFDFLPVARVPGYRQWVRTGHQHDLGHAAALFGLRHHPCGDAQALDTALDHAASGGWHLIVCDTRTCDTVAQHRDLLALLARP
ncbi:MAG: 2-succinyl-5-enolpyruvyl-6-hydroxy-3-cyclohexene-1-carboxylate synthase, partial [Planctomycetes bacterium]|nr:2-succinyl-5-enolpyruvyl-6-hydroxy-3-cyclohexene-1-carboxylate synthase [Planctomycetota bacterium]